MTFLMFDILSFDTSNESMEIESQMWSYNWNTPLTTLPDVNKGYALLLFT
jgi:hypothetical protein